MPAKQQESDPIRQSVMVDCPIDDAFRLFTEEFAEWWPLATHSLAPGESDHCEIEPWTGGRIYEESSSGRKREWGRILTWDPPRKLEFSWRPGRDSERETVEVRFSEEREGTRVTLVHRNWEHNWRMSRAQACSPFAGLLERMALKQIAVCVSVD